MSDFLDSLAHDRPSFFAELGRVVRYTPAGKPTRDVTMIVGEKSAPAELENLTSDGFELWIRVVAALVPELAQGDTVTIGTVNYTVDGMEEDRIGTIMATLIRA